MAWPQQALQLGNYKTIAHLVVMPWADKARLAIDVLNVPYALRTKADPLLNLQL